MISVPHDIQTRFQTLLASKAVPKKYHFHYKRWLRYYWDFCHKYGYPAGYRQSMPHFINKLREKKQKEFQIEQAVNAISMYYETVRQDIKASTPPTNIHQRKQFGDDGPRDSPASPRSTPAQPIEDSKNVVSENAVNYRTFPSTVASKEHRGKTYPAHLKIDNRNVRETDTEDQLGLPESGTSWKHVFNGLRDEIKLRHYSPKTLKSYSSYIAKFQAFTKSKAVASLTDEDIKAFLTFLAVKKNVAASTQNVAFNALLFFFRHVLKKEPGELKNIARAKRKPYIPVVLSRQEVDNIFHHLSHPYDLIAKLLYGCGLRLFECLNLRVNNFNMDAGILTVHDGKGKKDRTVPLPETIMPQIQTQLESVVSLHDLDLNAGYDGAFLFGRIEKKYRNAAKDLIWQWFFPAFSLTRVPETGEKRRYHIHERHVQRELREAVRVAKLLKRVTAHTFRHSYATHLLEANYDIRTIQEMLGHSDVRTTMIYTHTIKSRTLKEAKSPLDF